MQLDTFQSQAAYHAGGPCLVLAGPGSGKTRVLVARLAYLLQQGVAPEKILAVTYTRKASQEMNTRLERMGLPGSPIISTLHSHCFKLLRTYWQEAGLPENFAVITSSQQMAAVRAAIKANETYGEIFSSEEVLGFISWLANQNKGPADVAKDTKRIPGEVMVDNGQELVSRTYLMAQVYKSYQTILNLKGLLDFDGMLVRVATLLTENQEVCSHCQMIHVLVDEYQDTSPVQIKILALLAKNSGNLWAVGDPNQAVYAFRGADPENVANFTRDFGGKVFWLQNNYRSQKPILDLAFDLLDKTKGKQKRPSAQAPSFSGTISSYKARDDFDEAEWSLKQIFKSGSKLEESAILYRTHAQASALELTCLEYDIPYRIVGGVNFAEQPEIKPLLDLMLEVNKAENCQLPEIFKDSLKDYKYVLSGGYDVYFLLRSLLQKTNYEKHIKRTHSRPEIALEAIKALSVLAQRFMQTKGPCPDYVEAFVQLIRSGRNNTEGVSLLSLHASKGLEWDTVGIIGLNAGALPHRNCESKEEERRLFFVGITRARKNLYLSCKRETEEHGETKRLGPSEFWFDLDLKEAQPMGLTQGDEVKHKTYGIGTLSGIKPHKGDNYLTVKFTDNVERIFLQSSGLVTLNLDKEKKNEYT